MDEPVHVAKFSRWKKKDKSYLSSLSMNLYILLLCQWCASPANSGINIERNRAQGMFYRYIPGIKDVPALAGRREVPVFPFVKRFKLTFLHYGKRHLKRGLELPRQYVVRAEPCSAKWRHTSLRTSMSSSSTVRSGSCLCKSIKYEIIGDPITFRICHCMNCKKSSGSAFMSNLFFSKEVGCLPNNHV
jgi:hypothetical protein